MNTARCPDCDQLHHARAASKLARRYAGLYVLVCSLTGQAHTFTHAELVKLP